ncbi:Hypothetical predicted protein, partial [Olea europaea subsp. europaea]
HRARRYTLKLKILLSRSWAILEKGVGVESEKIEVEAGLEPGARDRQPDPLAAGLPGRHVGRRPCADPSLAGVWGRRGTQVYEEGTSAGPAANMSSGQPSGYRHWLRTAAIQAVLAPLLAENIEFVPEFLPSSLSPFDPPLRPRQFVNRGRVRGGALLHLACRLVVSRPGLAPPHRPFTPPEM